MVEELLTMHLFLPKNFRGFIPFLLLLFCLPPALQAAPNAFTTDDSIKAARDYLDQQDYDAALKALACYQKVLQISPGYFPAVYNVGALLALEHRWPEATTYFRNLLIEQPNNELVEFKLLLLLLHENSDLPLQAKLFATDLPTNTPAWYYSRAARNYKKGDPIEAAKYLEVAKNIYGDKTKIYQEELDESGLNSLPSK